MRMRIDQPAKSTSAGSGRQNEAVTFNGRIGSFGEVDIYNVRLTTSKTRNITYRFNLKNITKGFFDPVLTLRVNGRTFQSDNRGPGGDEVFFLTVNRDPQQRPVFVRTGVAAFRGFTLGNYRLSVTP